ncbi:MAG: hypothetical protein ACPGUV_03715, partial [Polyangiales bacterium]
MKAIEVLYAFYFVPLGVAAAFEAARVPTVLTVTGLHFVAGGIQSRGSFWATVQRRYGRALPWAADGLITLGMVAAALATAGHDGLWDETLPVWGLVLATAGNLLCLADHRGAPQWTPLALAVALVLLVPLLLNFSNWKYTLTLVGSANLEPADDSGCNVSWQMYWGTSARNSAYAECEQSVRVIRGDAKDRTLARLNVSLHVWEQLGGEVVKCEPLPRGAAGLYTHCTIPDGPYFWLSLAGLQPVFDHPVPDAQLDEVSAARYLVHNEVVGDLDYQCCEGDCRRLLVRHEGGSLTLMGPVQADNTLGSRFDHGRLRSTVGSYAHLDRCPALFHADPRRVRELWQQHRHNLTGDRLVAALDRWVGEHGADARSTYGAWSDGKGAFRWGAFYNSIIADRLAPGESVTTRK